MKSILIVSAHQDDAELMAGGSLIKWIKEGKKIYAVNYTDGELILPDGKIHRSREEAAREGEIVSKIIGYESFNIGEKNLHLQFSDQHVVTLLKLISKFEIDTIICPFDKDVHHDHEMAARIAVAASRRVPNLLMGQVNYFLHNFFMPNVFVDITDTWDQKIEALKYYKSQWRNDWLEFLDATSTYYGKMIGVKRAEGFYSSKILISNP